jgi:hypothetical protein
MMPFASFTFGQSYSHSKIMVNNRRYELKKISGSMTNSDGIVLFSTTWRPLNDRFSKGDSSKEGVMCKFIDQDEIGKEAEDLDNIVQDWVLQPHEVRAFFEDNPYSRGKAVYDNRGYDNDTWWKYATLARQASRTEVVAVPHVVPRKRPAPIFEISQVSQDGDEDIPSDYLNKHYALSFHSYSEAKRARNWHLLLDPGEDGKPSNQSALIMGETENYHVRQLVLAMKDCSHARGTAAVKHFEEGTATFSDDALECLAWEIMVNIKLCGSTEGNKFLTGSVI